MTNLLHIDFVGVSKKKLKTCLLAVFMLKVIVFSITISLYLFPENSCQDLTVLTCSLYSVGSTRGSSSQSQTSVTQASRNTKSLQFPTPHSTTPRSSKSTGRFTAPYLHGNCAPPNLALGIR